MGTAARQAAVSGLQGTVNLAGGFHFDEPRVIQSVRMRFNPIRSLTPDLLSSYLDQFRIGYLRNLVITWDAMERRDYQLKIVRTKRLKSVARLGFDIVTVAEIPDGQERLAEEQKAFLETFYNNLSATDALEPDRAGGFGLLVRQMMDAVGKYYSVHEIVWKPKPDGSLTAEFRWCPLYWFETTRGRLRFLENEFALYGLDMPTGEWLVTCGDGLMEACSVCYMFKHLPLKAWLSYLEKFGFPGVLGKTDAPVDSPQWNAMEDAVKSFSQDFAAVCNRSEELTLIDAAKSGQSEFSILVEKIDRAMTQMWRGGDLGTMGSTENDAKGVSLQASEAEMMEADDASLIEETLSTRVSRQALAWKFGEDAPFLAYIKLRSTQKDHTAQDLQIDQFLLQAGAPLGLQATLERYNREIPEEGAELLEAPDSVAPSNGGPAKAGTTSGAEMDNAAVRSPGFSPSGDALTEQTRALLCQALADQFASLRASGGNLLKIEDDEQFRRALADWQKELERLEGDLLQHPGPAADLLVKAQVAALANGIEAAARGKAEMANGGLGSGNFGHKGRPGMVGGSKPSIEKLLAGQIDEVAYAPVAADVAAKIKAVTGRDVAGFQHFIDRDALVHIDRQHGVGKEDQPDHEPVTRDDIEKIPQIVAHPDSVEARTTARGMPGVIYGKRFNGTTYYVEEEWTKDKLLAAKTMFKMKSAPGNSATPGGGVSHTSETSGA